MSAACPAQTTATATGMPWLSLLLLAAAGFITILTEALPAGLLPELANALQVSEAWVGQLVTVYAVGSLLAAIPIIRVTGHWPRRRLLLMAIAGFALTNAITAWSGSYGLTLVARGLAGVSAGVLWALVAGYASRLVTPALQGRAIAVAMVGTPLALSLGIPLGTLLGGLVGWRWTFALMSVLSLLLLVAARLRLPLLPTASSARPAPFRMVLHQPGLARNLLAMLLFVLAHNVLYTYIAPLVARAGQLAWLGGYLLLFGLAALAGIAITGALVDRHLHRLIIVSTLAFIAAALVFTLPASTPLLVVALLLWGIAFGGAPTLFQTETARRAGDSADIAQSMVVTAWNLAIAGGGILGGMALQWAGSAALAWTTLPLLGAALWLALVQQRRFSASAPHNDG